MGAPRAFWGSIAMAWTPLPRGTGPGKGRRLARSSGGRRRVLLIAHVPGGRQANPEGAAPSRHRFDLDLAAVAAHDLVGDRKTQACALSHALGGEEWIEDALDQLGRNATAV